VSLFEDRLELTKTHTHTHTHTHTREKKADKQTKKQKKYKQKKNALNHWLRKMQYLACQERVAGVECKTKTIDAFSTPGA